MLFVFWYNEVSHLFLDLHDCLCMDLMHMLYAAILIANLNYLSQKKLMFFFCFWRSIGILISASLCWLFSEETYWNRFLDKSSWRCYCAAYIFFLLPIPQASFMKPGHSYHAMEAWKQHGFGLNFLCSLLLPHSQDRIILLASQSPETRFLIGLFFQCQISWSFQYTYFSCYVGNKFSHFNSLFFSLWDLTDCNFMFLVIFFILRNSSWWNINCF